MEPVNDQRGGRSSYVIVGAGAIGSIVGAHLINGGHDVTFVDTNEEHVRAVREHGLRLQGAADLTVHAPIFTPGEYDGPLDHVLLAVKSRHTEDAVRWIAQRLDGEGFVVSLQNGLEELKIASAVGEARTIGAFLTFGGHYLEPGVVVYGGTGSFKIGELDGSMSKRLGKLQRDLRNLQPVEITDNIFGFLWGKIALGAVYFATATVSADVPDILAREAYGELFGNLAAEVLAVGEASGVRLEAVDGFDPTCFRFGEERDAARVQLTWDAQRAYWNSHVQRRTGVWRDLAIHKRKTEVDRFVANVITNGTEYGMEVPRIQALVSIVHEIEDGKRELGWHNLDELAAVDRGVGAGTS